MRLRLLIAIAHKYNRFAVSTSMRIPAKTHLRKGTARSVSENIAANLGCLWIGRRDRGKGLGEFLPFGPQSKGFCQNERNREKYRDWLAEGVGFEPTRPFRA